ncbi:hypothetical protein D3C79_781850 [compost metagenome]
MGHDLVHRGWFTSISQEGITKPHEGSPGVLRHVGILEVPCDGLGAALPVLQGVGRQVTAPLCLKGIVKGLEGSLGVISNTDRDGHRLIPIDRRIPIVFSYIPLQVSLKQPDQFTEIP